jgi:AraC family transcriptional regulator of adaptative response / DNA-3-methyladenine glycosylase II
MPLSPDTCRRALDTRDPRFDGTFYVGVVTTGIYCRPSCPARPLRKNVRFYATAAAAQAAGLRACKRCRPDAVPGSPEWDRRADVVGRAMRLVADGVVDRDGVTGLAARLGYSERHLGRLLVEEVGVGPLALARARRAHAARLLLETTDVRVTDVVSAAGFSSVRQFNDTIREVFAMAPRELRARSRRGGRPPKGEGIALRLPVRAPLDADGLLSFLAARLVPGVEEVEGDVYRRSLALPHGAGVVELRLRDDGPVEARFRLDDLRDLGTAAQRCRALLDLDADPVAVAERLGRDRWIGPLVRRRPGLRVPGTVDGAELAVRAVLGQQVSLAGAATLAGRLVRAHGTPLATPVGGVTHVFPAAQALAALDPETVAMPRARGRALAGLAAALADGSVRLDPGADAEEARAALLALPGIGPWTVDYVTLRALRDPDAFVPGDLGLRHALAALGAPPEAAEAWRPYRAYAAQHLWTWHAAGSADIQEDLAA